MLSNEEKRKIYERYGEEGLKQHEAQGGGGGGGGGDMFSQCVPALMFVVLTLTPVCPCTFAVLIFSQCVPALMFLPSRFVSLSTGRMLCICLGVFALWLHFCKVHPFSHVLCWCCILTLQTEPLP